MIRSQWIIYLLSLGCLILGTGAKADIPIQEWVTAKKIPVIFVPDTTSELVSVYFSFKDAGAKTDPRGQEGLTHLMLDLLMERTEAAQNKFLLSKKLRKLGVLGGFHSQIDSDNIYFSFKCPKEKLKEVLEIFKLILVTPAFDGQELAKAKSQDPIGTRLGTSDTQQFASRVLFQTLFAPHPYAVSSDGTVEGRQVITLKDIEKAYQDRLTRDRLVFSVVGNISRKSLSEQLDMAFGDLPAKGASFLSSTPVINDKGGVIVVPKASAESGVVFGQKGVSLQSPDILPFLIMNDVLGGKPFTSRLWDKIREKQGLVYSIQTELESWKEATLLIGGFRSDNQMAKKVIADIQEEWKIMQEKGISLEEFKAAKKGLLGSYALNFVTPGQIARYLLNCYLNGLTPQYANLRNPRLEAVTLEDVNRVAKTVLDPARLTFVVVGSPKE